MGEYGIPVALALCSLIGLSLGLVGGGGSTITLPVLVYVAGLTPHQAVAVSLAIVGGTSLVGAVAQVRQRNVDLRAGLLFAVAGMVGALAGAPLTRLAPGPVLMTIFAALMLGVGARMLQTRQEVEPPPGQQCRPVVCAAAGLGVGVLTGFLGMGGGFLIVPALLRFGRLPMRQAAGTSLVVIAANSAAGLAGHAGQVLAGGWLTAAFTGMAVAGLFGGLALARRMHPTGLKSAFAGLAIAVGAWLLVVNFRPLLGLIEGARGG